LKNILHKIFYLLPKRDPIRVAFLFLLMLVAAGLEVIGIGMIPAFVSIVATPELVLEHESLQALLNFFSVETSQDLLILGSAVLVGVFILKSIYIVIFNFYEARFVYNRRYHLMHRLMRAYMYAPYTFHLQRNTAELLRNITQETNILINNVFKNILTFTREAIMAAAILLLLFLAEPLITLLVMLISGLGAGSFIFMTRRKVNNYGKQEQEHRKQMIKAVNQGLGGIKDARVLNREHELIEQFRVAAYDSSMLRAYIQYIKQIPRPVVETSAVIGMMLISGLLVLQGREMVVIVPVLTLFGMATVRLMPAVQQLSTMYTDLKYNIVSLNPLYNDLKELEQESRIVRAERLRDSRIELEHQIEAENLVFSYEESSEQALKGISFTIPKGQAVAFVGESGAGKTTVVDLLLGLLTPGRGAILVDDFDIQQDLSAWQKNIGYIPQFIYLADETLRRNIAFGLPEEEIENDKVMRAIRLAQLEPMVHGLPGGIETVIGENGTRLSGGQRQRVGIARALYHDPQVLVMDEATSALDNVTEKQITEAIESLKGDRTIVMIAHRLSTVENCDTLYLMKDGEITDRGSYDELAERNNDFRRMALIP
jgi:ATP-binding cassette, subfamily B, bacterial PglK